jgi:ectoine hydroxylase-related dioxygenase (phytanoyl-CoA dioxygenase family)
MTRCCGEPSPLRSRHLERAAKGLVSAMCVSERPHFAREHDYERKQVKQIAAPLPPLTSPICSFHLSSLVLPSPEGRGHLRLSGSFREDYGYWYRDGFLFPEMLSVLTALTPATRQNGCLQVIKGSHKLGRIEHGVAGGQVGADNERVEEARKRLELFYVEMNPGDTLFFHSNLLHRSDSNRSDSARWSLISAYNLISNKPFKGDNTSSYTPIEKVPDSSILQGQSHGISEAVNFKHK